MALVIVLAKIDLVPHYIPIVVTSLLVSLVELAFVICGALARSLLTIQQMVRSGFTELKVRVEVVATTHAVLSAWDSRDTTSSVEDQSLGVHLTPKVSSDIKILKFSGVSVKWCRL